MPINFNSNDPLRARNSLGVSNELRSKNLQRLASGRRINNAGDDAAGLGIAETLSAQIAALGQAERNVNDGYSLTQVADGALASQNDILLRMRELAVQSANGTLSNEQRTQINSEYTALKQEFDRIGGGTEFNGQKLLDGSLASGATLQIGANNSANDQVALSISDARSTAVGVGGGSVQNLSATGADTQANAQNALATIDQAIHQISSRRANVGQLQNRLDVVRTNLGHSIEAQSAARSRIRDVDVAHETAELTRNDIASQAGVSLLAQTNRLSFNVLKLLRGGS